MWEDKRLRDITEADVRQLVDSGLEEHLQLEYKSALYDGNDQGSRESLLDICMFANAGGGILLIGVSELRDGNNQPTGTSRMRSLTFCGRGCSDQQQPQAFPRMASRPSQTMRGRTARAAIGSAHFTCQIALIASPAKAITDR